MHTITADSLMILKKSTSPILVSFSGGPDSIYLVKQLIQLKLNLICIYFEHGIRRQTINDDQTFIKQFCDTHSIKLIMKRLPVKQYATSHRCSIETSGRILRKSILWHLAKRYKTNIICTGHHLDDHAETFLFQLSRGSKIGLHSLKRNYKYAGIHWIKPLSETSKETIIKTLQKSNQSYLSDETNHDKEISRNKIRWNVVPNLKIINNRFNTHIGQTIDFYEKCLAQIILTIDLKEIKTKQMAGYYECYISRNYFDTLTKLNQSILIHKMLKQVVEELDYSHKKYSNKKIQKHFFPSIKEKHIDLLLSENGPNVIEITHQYSLRKTKKKMSVVYSVTLNKIMPYAIPLNKKVKTYYFDHFALTLNFKKHMNSQTLDHSDLIIRSCAHSDEWRRGSGERKNITRYLKSIGILKRTRVNYPLVEYNGTIVGVLGIDKENGIAIEEKSCCFMHLMVQFY